MKERGLLKRPIAPLGSDHRSIATIGHRIYPNLMQNLVITGPNQVWSADITYIGIRHAFVYLAVILDLFARRADGLCHLPQDRHRFVPAGPPDGHCRSASSRGGRPSLRKSGRPVCLSRLCRSAFSSTALGSACSRKGKSLRQRCRRELFRKPFKIEEVYPLGVPNGMPPFSWAKCVRVVGRQPESRDGTKGTTHEAPKKFCRRTQAADCGRVAERGQYAGPAYPPL